MSDIQPAASRGNSAAVPSGVEWALYAASCGWAVFPIRPGTKEPYSGRSTAAALGVSPDERAGVYHARHDADSIRALWSDDRSGAMIGLAMGSGRMAIDLDEKNGKSGAATMAANGWTIPQTAAQWTPSGGAHYVVAVPDGTLAPTDTDVGDGIDRRGDGGYIALYDPAMLTVPIAVAPEWATAGAVRSGERIPSGEGERAPTYEIALAALRSREPDSMDRNEWLLFSGSFYAATLGLVDDATARADWLTWNVDHGEKNDPAANGRTWTDHQRNGTGGDWRTLADLSNDANAKGWRWFKGITAPPAPPGAGLPRAANDRDYRALDWFTPSALSGIAPPREWLVPGMIPIGTVTLLGGDGGTGKSLLALQLAAATVAGESWLDRAPAYGTALYLSAEDDRDELHRRMAAIGGMGGLSRFGNLHLLSLAHDDALLATLERNGTLQPTALHGAIEKRIAEISPRLVVLDTLADLFPGNENDRAQARQFVAMLRGWAIRHRCAVLLLAHPSKAGLVDGSGLSGSTAWNNSVRSRLYLERIRSEGIEPDTDARRLVLLKSNYGRTGDEIGVRYHNGAFVARHGAPAGEANERGDRAFLRCLRARNEQGRWVNSTSGPNYAPTQFAKMAEADGMTKNVLRAAMERLFAIGAIQNGSIRENRKDRTILVLSDAK